ncbi:ABC transporter permease [Jiangella alba]|uniref:Peptide/nickel transport system permease protein n=1 Tax=Jiangella alba TaxID=561176 RepID=A0A1H5LAQ8_9ACTN|nr:ABC transporter permease [Jiangella alba]SEE73298.1 peptide/nickel transport system permease protein [Jiangella alba]
MSPSPAALEAAPPAATVAPTHPSRPRRLLGRAFAAVPYVVLACYLIAAVVGPLLIDYDPVDTPLVDRLLAPGSRTSTGELAVLGTDHLGRDVLAQVVYGARTSVLIGAATVIVASVVGCCVGVIAGYSGGLVDTVLARIMDITLAFPGILLAIVIAGVLDGGAVVVVAALAVSSWIGIARVARGVAVSVRSRPWTDAARMLGVRPARMIVRHIVPFAVGPVVALATVEFALVVLAEAGLSFLGVGLPASAVSWGQTIANGKEYLASAWWISAFAGVALAGLVVSVGLIGDAFTQRYGRGFGR